MVTHLLVHGFAGTPLAWAEIVPRLSGNATAPAVPGHNAPARNTFADYVDWLVAEVSLVAPPVHLVGYSAGGRIVAGALARGIECAAATLISTNLGLGSERERAERAVIDAAWSKLLRDEGIDAFTDAWEAQPIFASQSQASESRRVWQRMSRTSLAPDVLADAMDALSLSRMPDLRAAMRAIRVPWQLVVGALDTKFVALAKGTGATRVTELAGCGHNPLIEAPEALAVTLNNFVNAAP